MNKNTRLLTAVALASGLALGIGAVLQHWRLHRTLALRPPVSSYAPVVSKVAPAVVTVRSEQRARTTQQRLPFMEDPRFRDFFGEQFGPRQPMPQPRRSGLGSDVIVKADGYVLTNHHVVDNADKVEVELTDRRTFTARIVGSDEASDLAVLKRQHRHRLSIPANMRARSWMRW